MQDDSVEFESENDFYDTYEKYGDYDDFEDDPVFEKTNRQSGLAKFR